MRRERVILTSSLLVTLYGGSNRITTSTHVVPVVSVRSSVRAALRKTLLISLVYTVASRSRRLIIDISVSRPCLKSTCQRRRRRRRNFHAVDVRCSAARLFDRPRQRRRLAADRIRATRAGSYGRAIGADDQNQYAGRAAEHVGVRSVGSSVRSSVSSLVLPRSSGQYVAPDLAVSYSAR